MQQLQQRKVYSLLVVIQEAIPIQQRPSLNIKMETGFMQVIWQNLDMDMGQSHWEILQ